MGDADIEMVEPMYPAVGDPDDDMDEGMGPAYTDLWNDLKKSLDDDMQKVDLNSLTLLMKDKLDAEFSTMLDIQLPSDLLAYLENNWPLSDAVSIMKHVLATLEYHTEQEGSLGQKIVQFENDLKQIQLQQNVGPSGKFIGRRKEMEKVEEAINGDEYNCVWIYGNGGQGKTTLATEMCIRMCLKQPWKIINVDLKQITDSREALGTILAQLNSSSTSKDFTTMLAEVQELIRQLPDKGVIILLDNVEGVFDTDKFRTDEKMSRAMDKLLSVCQDVGGNKRLKFIVTSRSKYDDTPCSHPEILELQLGPLSEKYARRLIRISCKPVSPSKEHIQTILTMCGNVPLAIRLVCNTIRAMPHVLKDNLARLGIQDVLQNDMSECVRYAFQSMDREKQLYLEMLAVYETSTFDEADVAAVLDIPPRDASLALMFFCHRHILEQTDVTTYSDAATRFDGVARHRTGYTYSFHPLVWNFLQNKPKSEIVMPSVERFVLRMFKKIEQNCEGFRKDYAKALAFVNKARRNIKHMIKLMSERGPVMTGSGHIRDLLMTENNYLANIYSDAIASQQQRLRTMSSFTNSLAVRHDAAFYFWKLEEIKCCIDLKQYSDALSQLQSISTGVEKLDQTKFSYVIAEFYYTKGRAARFCDNVTEALECFDTSIHLFENCRPEGQYVVKIADAFNAKGNAFFDRKDYDQSLFYHAKALELVNKHEVDHPSKYNYIFNIGTVAFEKGKLANDESTKQRLYQQSLENMNASMEHDKRLGLHEVPQYANKLRFRWKVLRHQEKYKEAIEDAESALRIRRKHDTVHPEITKACHDVGFLYMAWRQHESHDSEKRKHCLVQALEYFGEMEEEIRNGGLPRNDADDHDHTQMLESYLEAAKTSQNEKELRRIKRFINEFKTNTLESQSSSDNMSESESDSDTSSSMETDAVNPRRDSGFTESISSSEVSSGQIRGNESVSSNRFFRAPLQSQVSDEVFMDMSESAARRVTSKRQRSDSFSD